MVLCAALLSVFAALALISENRRHTIEVANRENTNIARMVGFHVSHLLTTGIRLLDSVAQNVEAHGLEYFLNKEGKQILLNRTQGYPELQTMLIISAKGKLLVGASVPYPPPNLDYGDRDYFLLHKAGANLVFGEQLMSRSHGRRGTTISRAIRSKTGELEALVLITIESAHFAQLFQTTQHSANQEITIMRNDGAIFVRFPEVEVGRRFPDAEVLSAAVHAPSGNLEGDSAIDHLPRLFSYEQLKDFPLVVVASQHTQQVLAPWRVFSATVLLGLLLALLLLGAASWYAFASAAETEALSLELERLAQTDSLTGLTNRRHFMELADKELSRTERYGGAMSVLMLDIDHFKKVNDTYGHASGDVVLQRFARVFLQELRDIDIVGRLGGEEFAVILTQTDGEQAIEVAERLRARVANGTVDLPQGFALHCTVSIGVSTLCGPEDHIEGLLSLADRALYKAKRTGRNRVLAAWCDVPELAAS